MALDNALEMDLKNLQIGMVVLVGGQAILFHPLSHVPLHFMIMFQMAMEILWTARLKNHLYLPIGDCLQVMRATIGLINTITNTITNTIIIIIIIIIKMVAAIVAAPLKSLTYQMVLD